MLPIDLVFVRHGQAVTNSAKRLSEKGDNSAYTPEFRCRHSSSFPLTDLGRKQAAATGIWIKENLGDFDYCMTSSYVRAMETAALMNLPNARWYPDPYLAERDWGDIETLPENEIAEKFGEVMRVWRAEPFFRKPPNGESFLQLCLRAERVLDRLRCDCTNKRVIIVCHGDTMLAFRFLIERIPIDQFKQMLVSKERYDRIYNGQIIHYTRRRPNGKGLSCDSMWMQMVSPTENPVWMVFRKLVGLERRYSNEELLEIISRSQGDCSQG